jgi:hypothetical protein
MLGAGMALLSRAAQPIGPRGRMTWHIPAGEIGFADLILRFRIAFHRRVANPHHRMAQGGA